VQVKPQDPDAHVAFAWATAGQVCPHEPQLVVSVDSFTHADPQPE
jgi:hypothetical protein